MVKCEYCGMEYKENTADLSFLPEVIREKLKYVPSCYCLEEQRKAIRLAKEKTLEYERQLNKIKKYRDISVVDNQFRDSTFNKANMDEKHMKLAKKYAEKFLEKGTDKGILFFGDCGTGKTFASACIANHLMKHGKTVLALNLNGYLNRLKVDWAEAERDILAKVLQCDLLIIDDFGTEKKSDWMLEKVFSLIDARYRSNKPLIITTNLNYDENSMNCEISKHFTIDGKDRIKDRINAMCYPYRVAGTSKRKITAEEFAEFLS
jgi:DNA replication protein DnaC